MIKAIIFDCFGVLVEDSLTPFYRNYLKDESSLITLAHQKMVDSNRGKITYEQFVDFLSNLAGVSYDETYKALDKNPRNEQLLSYIKTKLSSKYEIGFLSNASDDWLDELFTIDDLKLFDAMVLSYKIGFAKPEARAYEITADKLSVRLDECIFIDDRPEYVEGAQHVGMKTILYKDFQNFKKDLDNVLG